MKLVLMVQNDVLTVPSQAVMTGQAGSYVYLVNPDRTVRTVDVTMGRQSGNYTVISGGVTPGQQVVTDGQLRLVPGARGAIKGAAGGGAGAADSGGAP